MLSWHILAKALPRNALFGQTEPVRVLACQPPKCLGGTGWQIDAEFPRPLGDLEPKARDAWRLAPVNGKNLSARQQLTECWKGLGEEYGSLEW